VLLSRRDPRRRGGGGEREAATVHDGLHQRRHELAQTGATVLADPLPRRQRERVGGVLDPQAGGAALLGERALPVEPTALLHLRDRPVPLLVGVGAARLQRLAGPQVALGHVQDGGFEPGHALADQCRDVAVPAELAQQGDGVPQGQMGLGRPGQTRVPGVQGAAVRGAALACGAGQRQRLDDLRAVQQVTAQPAQRVVDAAVARVQHLLRRHLLPDAGHAELHGERGEVEERRLHDGPAHGAHRRRPSREVTDRPVLGAVQPDLRVLLLRVRREVDHRVERFERTPGDAADLRLHRL